MDTKKIKLIVAHAKCENCGKERLLYFASGFSYGERIVLSASGKQCAYVNLLDENLMQELELHCMSVFCERRMEISHTKLVRTAACLYGITCDDIYGEKIDTISVTKCPYCLGKMVEDDEYGEKTKEIDMSIVTHDKWLTLNEEEKREKIVKELIRQGYLS